MNEETQTLYDWLLAHPGPGSLGWFKGMVDGEEPAVGAERLREWTWAYAPVKFKGDEAELRAWIWDESQPVPSGWESGYALLLAKALRRVDYVALAIALAALPDEVVG